MKARFELNWIYGCRGGITPMHRELERYIVFTSIWRMDDMKAPCGVMAMLTRCSSPPPALLHYSGPKNGDHWSAILDPFCPRRCSLSPLEEHMVRAPLPPPPPTGMYTQVVRQTEVFFPTVNETWRKGIEKWRVLVRWNWRNGKTAR